MTHPQRGGRAQAAFQRGLAALAQWVEKEGQRPVPRSTVMEITVDGEAEPVPVKLGGVALEHQIEARQAHPGTAESAR